MKCNLCPRRCNADRSSHFGFCRLGGEMLIARIAPHYWEEPPISGTNGTGAVFFSGCTLRCVYCQNGDISHRNEGRPFTPAELSDSLKRLEDLGVHTISFITATPFIPQILETLSLWRPPVPLVWNTSGYETVESLRRLDGVVDVYLPDLKHFTARSGRLCAGAPDYFEQASAALAEMCRQTGSPEYDADGIMRRGTLVRHLILPGLTGESLRLRPVLRSVSCGSISPATAFPFPGSTAASPTASTAASATICWLSASPVSSRNLTPPTGTSSPSSTGPKASSE